MKNKLTARELSSFCGQMGMLLHSGISTAEGLHILCDESKADTDRQILTPLIRSVEENGSLSRALDESGIFPASMTAYVRTGEETGCLDEIMESLSSHYEQEEEISGQIRSAVTYPLIMLGMMAVVILVLLIKVLPVFQQVFNQMGLEMNGVSRGLLNAGNMISRYSSGVKPAATKSPLRASASSPPRANRLHTDGKRMHHQFLPFPSPISTRSEVYIPAGRVHPSYTRVGYRSSPKCTVALSALPSASSCVLAAVRIVSLFSARMADASAREVLSPISASTVSSTASRTDSFTD